jgi:PAS domain S-box-containing protein
MEHPASPPDPGPADSPASPWQTLTAASRALLRRLAKPLARRRPAADVLLQAVPDALIGVDAQGRIRVASPTVANLFGEEPDQLLGKPLSSLLPGLDAPTAQQRTRDGLYLRNTRTHVARFDATARRHGETEFPAEVSLAQVEDGGDLRYACLVRDVTDRRMADGLLALYVRALDCSSNGVLIIDLGLPGQPIVYANHAFQQLTGHDRGDAVGRSWTLLLGAERDQPEAARVRQAMAAGEAATAVLRSVRTDGRMALTEFSVAPVPPEDGPVPRHMVAILNDVTERERARLAIAERNARLNAVFDLSPDGFVVFDRDGALLYVNHAFRQLTGWAGDPVDGTFTLVQFDRWMRTLCDVELPYPALCDDDGGVGDAEATGPATGVELLQLVRPRRAVLTRLARHNAGGQGESILYFRDVTHETEVDRMKSEFLTTAAHELRTPMVSVFGFTELLLNRPVPEGRRRDVPETIHRQASLLITMINDLLDLAHIESPQGRGLRSEPMAVAELVQRTINGLLVPPSLRVVPPEPRSLTGWVHADGEKFQRALTNVLSNAIKYSPQGGEIVVTVMEGRIDGAPAVGVRVRDQGIGMTGPQQARVFERFYRADPSGDIPGTGLGMCLVKEILDLHGGRIDLHSIPGQGTTVTMWWLAADSPEAHAAPHGLPGRLPQSRPEAQTSTELA